MSTPHLEHAPLTLRLPVAPASVGAARRAAAEWAQEAGHDAPALSRVRLAVSEAVSNVVLHAHVEGDAAGHDVVVAAEGAGSSCTISVTDRGSGLRPRADSPGMGLGLALIAASCDELYLDAGPDGGTVVRMTFTR